MTKREALAKIQRGHIFRVLFVKRTTGEMREMVCRQGVVKHLAGGEAAYSFNEKGLLPVFDMQKKAYRSIPKDGIVALTYGGETYKDFTEE